MRLSPVEVEILVLLTPNSSGNFQPKAQLLMNTLLIPRLFLRSRTILLCLGLASALALSAQTGTGAIEGRVFDPARDEYLKKARLTIEGTNLETFTAAGGNIFPTSVRAVRESPLISSPP